MNKLLIWDIDGTLIQGRGIGRRAMDRVFLKLYGIKDALNNVEMAGMLDSIIIKNAFKIHSLEEKCKKEFLEDYFESLTFEITQLKSSIDAPGILELLKTLDALPEFFNVLGTGNLEMGARIKLSKHDMNKYFHVGGFGEEEMERWQVIEKAVNASCNYFGVNFDNTNIFVIGDTPRDIFCGKKLNYKTIAVATGMYTFMQLEECDADYVFEDLSDTAKFLEIFK